MKTTILLTTLILVLGCTFISGEKDGEIRPIGPQGEQGPAGPAGAQGEQG